MQIEQEQEQVVEEKVNLNLLPHKQEAPIQVNSELPVQNQNQDKQEPMKNEMPSGYTQRAEQLRIDMAKRMSEAAEELHNTNKWNSINPQFSTTKCLPFNQTHKSYDFWKSNVANDIQDMFKALMPRKIVIGIMNHLNRKMKSIFPDQDDRQLKKKMYKIEQVYEYFAIKILMGYNRMPDPEDYFNEKLGFRNKICELIKEGRFKFFEAQTQFSDEILYHFKLKIENKEPKHKINGEILTYVVKKMNKVFRQACDAGQSLALIRNTFFDAQEMDKEVYCLMLFDVRTLFILQIGFAYAENTNNCIFRLLDNYKNRNHRLYLQKGLLTLDEINQLALQFSIYGSGILNKTERDDKIVFTGDLITNGMMLLLRLRMPDGGQSILASTADGFHRNTTSDKRSYATVQLQEVIKKVEQYMYQSDQYRCLFSSATLHGALFTEVQEIVIWNSFIAYKEIQKIDQNIEFLTYRLNLTKQLLAGKIKNLPISSLTMQQLNPKINTVGINTDITGNFGMQNKERLPYQNFHIPTKLIPPSKLQGTLVCLVCRKNTNDFTECKSCGEISGKLISLCASECFSQFHIDPKKFITGAEDIPVLQTGTQFEQSTLWQSANYQKSYEKKKADQQPK